MTKNPLINSLSATAYIVLVSLVLTYVPKLVGPMNSVIGPVAMLSLFVLSAAVMGYLFVFQPIQMYLDGDKKPAIKLSLQTLAFFAVITIVIFVFLVLK